MSAMHAYSLTPVIDATPHACRSSPLPTACIFVDTRDRRHTARLQEFPTADSNPFLVELNVTFSLKSTEDVRDTAHVSSGEPLHRRDVERIRPAGQLATVAVHCVFPHCAAAADQHLRPCALFIPRSRPHSLCCSRQPLIRRSLTHPQSTHYHSFIHVIPRAHATTITHPSTHITHIAGKDRVDNKNAKNKCVLLAQGEGGHGGHPNLHSDSNE
jgi:hypothetical protein